MPAPVTLLLPALDEAAAIGGVIASVPRSIRGRRVDVVVIDDGSADATVACARRAGAAVISHGNRRGLGAAIRTGLAYAARRDTSAVAFCDADGEYSPADLERVVAPILEGRAHYVVGSRFDGHIERMLTHRRIGNRVLTRVFARIAGTPISDAQSGFRALSPAAAAAAEIAHDYNYAQVLTLDLLHKGFGYAEVPITYSYREHGTSFVRVAPYLRHVVPAVLRMRRPRDRSIFDDVVGKTRPSDRPGRGIETSVGV